MYERQRELEVLKGRSRSESGSGVQGRRRGRREEQCLVATVSSCDMTSRQQYGSPLSTPFHLLLPTTPHPYHYQHYLPLPPPHYDTSMAGR